MTSKPGLTSYAKAHLRLIEIDKRFNKVCSLREDSYTWMSFGSASREGRDALDCLARDQKLFDLYVHGKQA